MTRRIARLAPAVAAGLVAACATSGDPIMPGPERARVQLDEPEIRAIAQLLRHEDERVYDAPVFERLAGGGEEVRRRVAVAAGRIGDTLAVSLLTRLLDDDPSPGVRADAAFALGQLGDTSRVVIASLRGAVPASWAPVRPAETTVVVEVVHALGKLGTFQARAMVLDALRSVYPGDGEHTRRVAAEALLAAWRFDHGPGRVNAVARYIAGPDPELRWRAAYALMRLGEPDGAARLLDLVDDADHRVRAYAARGLAAAAVDSAGFREPAVAALTAALRDGHPHVRIFAVRSLAGYGDDAPTDVMASLLDDPDNHVAMAAAGALAGRGEARDALLATVSDSSRPHPVRAAAAQALGPEDPDPVADVLDAWVHGPFEARYAAARTLPSLGWERGEAPLRRLAEDDDVRVAAAALRGLEPLMDSLELTRRLSGLGAGVAVGPEAIPEPSAGAMAFYEEMVRTYVAPPLAGERRPRAVIRTAGGEIVIELLAEEAPLTVHNFITLAGHGFWDNGVWHRVIPNFVLQDGAPGGDPSGGPGWSIRDEINRVRYTRGVLGMALSGPDTGGSQWFITHSPQHHLDGGYTVFGRVVDGMRVADAVLQGHPIQSVRIR